MISNISSSRYANFFGKKAKLPASTVMWTKGQCKLSEEELVSRIVDLARRDAAAGKNSLHDDQFVGSEWNTLFHNYISLSSPDRVGIIQKKLGLLAGQGTTSRVKGFDLFCAINRKGRRRDPDVNPDNIIFRDEYGREVAVYSKRAGWITHITPAESARTREFIELWNQALADAQKELESEAEEGITFEAWA